MPAMNRLVLFVEGEGDRLALPSLVGHLLDQQQAYDCLFLDGDVFRIGDVRAISGNVEHKWTKKLRTAAKRPNLGGVLAILDGDADRFEGQPFCAASSAKILCDRAKQAGAGSRFSLAVVFACKEYESWLIASLQTLVGKNLPPDNRQGIKAATLSPGGNLEQSPRDAKGWLSGNMHMGYKPTTDQAPLTQLLLKDLSVLRRAQLRSFVRLEKAIRELVAAIRSKQHIVSPC